MLPPGKIFVIHPSSPLQNDVSRVKERQSARKNPPGNRFWWVGLLLLHCVNLGYYTGVAMMCNSIQGTFMFFQLRNYSIGIHATAHPTIVGVHAAIAAIHAAYIAVMVLSSIYARQLVFRPDLGPLLTRLGWWRTQIIPSQVTVNRSDDTRPRPMSRTLGTIRTMVFARDGLLGVDSVFFDHVLLARELVETSLQTYQLYRMTLLLPRLWLIRFYLVLLVGSCWSVPVLHRIYRHNESKRRLLCLLCDAVLAMLSSVGVALIIFATYARQYDADGFGFPFIYWYDDKWLSAMQHELEIMVVASWGDMASRVVIALGLLQCMDAIKEVLTPATLPPVNNKQVSDVVIAEPDKIGTKATKEQSSTVCTVAKVVVNYVGPGLFLFWGFAILAIHLAAESQHVSSVCELPLQPWLSSKPGCLLVELNCHVLESNGHDAVITSAWDAFNPQLASRVVIRHCPALVIDSKLQLFSEAAGFKVYNSTIIAWGDDGAVTGTHHGSLRTVTLVRTRLPNGELPRGLLSPDFPPLLFIVATCVTNIQRLPADLDTIWHSKMRLLFEYSLLTSIPDVLPRLNPDTLSFAGSPITTVPAEVFEGSELRVLFISFNHLQELPKNVTTMSSPLRVFTLQGSNVSTFWQWMDPFFARVRPRQFNAYHTRYCRELLEIDAGKRSAFSVGYTSDMARVMDVSTPAKLAFAKAAVDCSPGMFLTDFPLQAEDGQHRLR